MEDCKWEGCKMEDNETEFIENIASQIEEFIMKTYDNYTNLDEVKLQVKKIIDTCQDGSINKCISCGIDMGACNPRQLCGKTFCYNDSAMY